MEKRDEGRGMRAEGDDLRDEGDDLRGYECLQKINHKRLQTGILTKPCGIVIIS